MIERIQTEVQRRADLAGRVLWDKLLERLTSRDSFLECYRHDQLKGPYVDAQVLLTRAKRAFFREIISEDKYQKLLDQRNEIRRRYRAAPCTCWVKKR